MDIKAGPGDTMIKLYLGAVGSGKSYHAVADGLAVASSKDPERIVVANFPIMFPEKITFLNKGVIKRQREKWIYIPDEELKVDSLISISLTKGFVGKEGKSLLIIDEAGLFFNSRDWMVKAQERKGWIKFFSQSRKFGYDVILIAQEERMIDRQIRSMAEYHVVHKRLDKINWFRFIPVPVFLYVTYWTMAKFRGSLQFALLNKSIAKRYDTMRLFDIAKVIKEIESSKNDSVAGRKG